MTIKKTLPLSTQNVNSKLLDGSVRFVSIDTLSQFGVLKSQKQYYQNKSNIINHFQNMKLTLAILSMLVVSTQANQPVKLGEGAECWVKFQGQNYIDETDAKCDNSLGLDCNYHIEDDGITPDRVMGYCEITKCMGHNNNKFRAQEGTERITICHRTCAKQNPWVRVTIDKNGWADETICGHGVNHDVWDDCNASAEDIDLYWGGQSHDYVLMEHGSRQDVRDKLAAENPGFTPEALAALEDEYWSKWEPACPYVRNGQCCNAANGFCCGWPKEGEGGGDRKSETLRDCYSFMIIDLSTHLVTVLLSTLQLTSKDGDKSTILFMVNAI